VTAGLFCVGLALGALAIIALNGPTAAGKPGAGPGAPPAVPASIGDDNGGSSVEPSPSATATPSPSPHPQTPPATSPQPTQLRPAQPPMSYEAESAANVLGSGARVDRMKRASGGLAVYGIGGPNQGTLRFTGITATTSGVYALTVFYRNPDGTPRSARITVDNRLGTTLDFPHTEGCCVQTRSTTIRLTAGIGNTIEFANPVSPAPDIDRITIAPA
jgi:hypothetical protein